MKKIHNCNIELFIINKLDCKLVVFNTEYFMSKKYEAKSSEAKNFEAKKIEAKKFYINIIN